MQSQGVVTAAGSSSSVTTQTYYTYQWWDQAQQLQIKINATDPSNPNTGLWAPGYSNLTYDANGHLTQLVDTGDNKQVHYIDDAYGQVMMREQKYTNVSQALWSTDHLYYYLDGHRIGDISNGNPDSSQEDYAEQLAADLPANKQNNRILQPVKSANFDENFQPIDATYPGMSARAYTVQGGDTLQSIAQAYWGDSSLWYLIAQANGLDAQVDV